MVQAALKNKKGKGRKKRRGEENKIEWEGGGIGDEEEKVIKSK